MFKHVISSVKRKTTEVWETENPVLNYNELAVEIITEDNLNVKKGDGVTNWVDLHYFYENQNADDTNEIIDDYLVNNGSRLPVEDFFTMFGDGAGLKSDKIPTDDNDVIRKADLNSPAFIDKSTIPAPLKIAQYNEDSGLKSGKVPSENNDVVRKLELDNHKDDTAAHSATAIPASLKIAQYNEDSGLKSDKVPAEDNDVIRKLELDTHKSDTAAHSATATPTASRIAMYNSDSGLKSGKVPTENNDVIRLLELDNHKDDTAAHSATATPTASRIVMYNSDSGLKSGKVPTENNDVVRFLEFTSEISNIYSEISTLNGAYYVLDAYNFGKTLDETDPDDILILNTYAIANTPNASSMADVYDNTVIVNEFDSVEYVYNKTADTWVKYPNGYLTIATNTHLGVVKGTQPPTDNTDKSKDTYIQVLSDGAMKLIADNLDFIDKITNPTTDNLPIITTSGMLTDSGESISGILEIIEDGLDTKEDSINAGTTSQYWRGDKTWQTLSKSAVGLENVDNTSDTNKPISNAVQTALNGKVDNSTLNNYYTETEVDTLLSAKEPSKYIAASESAAQTYSAANPTIMVFYPEA
jgi:hypothetical protein